MNNSVFRLNIDHGGQKAKIQFSNQKRSLEVSNRFLVGKREINFFDGRFLRKKLKVQYLKKKIGPKVVPRGLKLNFGRKIIIQFFDPKWTLEIKNRFLVQKSKAQYFDQKLSLEVSNLFIVEI